jgi:molybdopterin-guanine dinucleotide biosynthesis protein A
VVLAGGANARYGGTLKGFLPLGRQRIVDRVLAALQASADETIVIANDPAIARALPGIRVQGDMRAERGGLSGLYSALVQSTDAALVVAWDMPFVSADLLRELRRIGEERSAAAIPEGAHGPEPLCAYYPRACLATVERRLDEDRLRLGAFVDALPAPVIMPLVDVARFGEPERLFANVNAPCDLEAAARWLDAAAPSQEHHLRNRDTINDSLVR